MTHPSKFLRSKKGLGSFNITAAYEYLRRYSLRKLMTKFISIWKFEIYAPLIRKNKTDCYGLNVSMKTQMLKLYYQLWIVSRGGGHSTKGLLKQHEGWGSPVSDLSTMWGNSCSLLLMQQQKAPYWKQQRDQDPPRHWTCQHLKCGLSSLCNSEK